ncbi:MAG: hypothetical protein MRERV_2c034 [Mycoplasmataceae bacterium RV_VA103A]|nr:MAG: hypothetical protein MRERV_2c034 [Mycoplasmataceae bacterium RV_VA103A]
MTQVKILAQFEGRQEEYFGDGIQGMSFTFFKFVSQETDNGVPKYEIFIMASDPIHPVMEEINKSSVISLYNDEEYRGKYCWEISFVDSKDLLKDKEVRENINSKNKAKRYFFSGQTPQSPHSSIKVVNKFYESKLEELKKLNNLIPGEESKWRGFIAEFHGKLSQLTNEDNSKYQKGKEFIDELETELNKKTGKGNDDDRERERERATCLT